MENKVFKCNFFIIFFFVFLNIFMHFLGEFCSGTSFSGTWTFFPLFGILVSGNFFGNLFPEIYFTFRNYSFTFYISEFILKFFIETFLFVDVLGNIFSNYFLSSRYLNSFFKMKTVGSGYIFYKSNHTPVNFAFHPSLKLHLTFVMWMSSCSKRTLTANVWSSFKDLHKNLFNQRIKLTFS